MARGGAGAPDAPPQQDNALLFQLLLSGGGGGGAARAGAGARASRAAFRHGGNNEPDEPPAGGAAAPLDWDPAAWMSPRAVAPPPPHAAVAAVHAAALAALLPPPAIAGGGVAADADAAARARAAAMPPPAVSELLQAFAGGADRVLASRMIQALGGMEHFAAVRATMLPQQALFQVRRCGAMCCDARCLCAGLATALTRYIYAGVARPQEQLTALHSCVRVQRERLAVQHTADADAAAEEEQPHVARALHTLRRADGADDDADAAREHAHNHAAPLDE